MKLVDVLEKLSNANGVTGREGKVRDLMKKFLKPYIDETREDRLGNVIGVKKGNKDAPTVMLAAHMDEVAFIVTHIEKTGFLRFHKWGITDNLLPGQRIIFKGKKGPLYGIIGTKPPHVMSDNERKRVLPSDELFIDIGAMTSDEAEKKGAHIGMTGVFDAEFLDLGDGYLRGKALDDRAGCFIMAEVFKAMKDSLYNVIAVGTVQEEVGLRGAVTAAWQLDPDYGLALEGTFAIDVPGSAPHKQSAGLKKGPVVTITDRGLITHPKVLETIVIAAQSEKIPYQYKKIPSGRTDASSIHLTKAGIPSGTIAAPCRYIHGPVAITTIEDLENTIKLVKAFIVHISNS